MNKQQLLDQLKSYFGLNNLSEQVRIYITLQIESIKTSIIDGSSKALYGVISGLVLAFLGFFMFLFLNLMLGFGISEWFFEGKYWTGFGIVTAFYLLLLVIFLLAQSTVKKKVEDSVTEAIKGSALELKSFPEIFYPESTAKETAEKLLDKEVKKEDKLEVNQLSEAEEKRLIEEELRRLEAEQNQE